MTDKTDATAATAAVKQSPRADLVMVPIDAIDADGQVRTTMDEPALLELARSIHDVGLLEPVIVRKRGKHFEMIAGHRRLAAAATAGEDLIEAKVYRDGDVDDRLKTRMQLTENLQREDLNHIDVARQLGRARDAGMTVAETAAEIACGADYVRRHLDLLRLCEPVAGLVASGRLPLKQALLIARVGDAAKQIELAGDVCEMEWDAKAAVWGTPRYSYREPTDEDEREARDHVMTMGELRRAVGAAMCGLAAGGWPKAEPCCGERACEGCPDNTATYTDQPALFAGIRPRGSARKGHCTNRACYDRKRTAWEKVRAAQKAEAAKKLAAKVRKAKAAGVSLCADCGKVVDDGTEHCAKCEAKRKRADDRGFNATKYSAERKRVAALERKFPWTTEQVHALALHDYGQELHDAIRESLDVPSPVLSEQRLGLALWAALRGAYCGCDLEKMAPTLDGAIVLGGWIGKTLAAIWANAKRPRESLPSVGWSGDVENVPLPAEHVVHIDALEGVALAWGLEIPERPTIDRCRRDAAAKVIAKGKRPDAEKAIADADGETLAAAVEIGLAKAKWRQKAVGDRSAELDAEAG